MIQSTLSRSDSVLNRFDKYLGPILINVFSKITHLKTIHEFNANLSSMRRSSFHNRFVCNRLFPGNSSLNQTSLHHIYPELYQCVSHFTSCILKNKVLFSLFKEEFKKASGIFQPDGLAMAANYSILNFQSPNREWKKVRMRIQLCSLFRLKSERIAIGW